MTEKAINYNKRNKESRVKYAKDYSIKNADKIRLKRKQNYENKKAIKQAYGRKYRKIYLKKAKDKIANWAREYSRKRRKQDPMFRLILNLRRRLNHLLSGSKSKRTMQLTGCNSEFLKQYLENKFLNGMTWGNYGKVWHVDHIYPLSRVNLFDETELSKVCHYTNLQPMFAEDNIRSSNKIKIRSEG